ncbi:hypothetical protein [Streptomyces bluensis]|uniref:hypothetical protein n=1 Tax=Streptomyces bluensis TaxID=33897 RepID=UPI00331E5DAE
MSDLGEVDLFRALHRSRTPEDLLVLPGPWDAASARVLAEAASRRSPRPALWSRPIYAPPEVLPLLRSGIQGPVNAFARLDGKGPSPTELGELGATRVTFGPGLQRWAALALQGVADHLRR